MNKNVKMIADMYGFQHQSMKLVEEMAELTDATAKMLLTVSKQPSQNFIEELADVKLVLDQVIYLSGKDDEVEQIVQDKIFRQLGRMAAEGLMPEEEAMEVYNDAEEEDGFCAACQIG